MYRLFNSLNKDKSGFAVGMVMSRKKEIKTGG
jgi:hypothetical protein